MKLCHAASSSSYLLCLSFEQPLRFPIKMCSFLFLCILHHTWAYVVARVMRRYSGANMNDMQLRVGSVGQISGGLGGQGRLFGTVGGQKDLGREDAHLLLAISHRLPRSFMMPLSVASCTSCALLVARARKQWHRDPSGADTQPPLG